ncbi:MAG: glycerol-3-phosphate 1-O-acyltransferase PlsY [Chloroflexota bacterium]
MNYLWLALVVPGYLLGAVPFAYIAVRLLGAGDIRQYGSGNVGATNALRVIGLGPSAVVLVLDFFKGTVAAWLGLQLSQSLAVACLCGLAAVAGHNWSVYLRFSGGKGVTTSLGALFVVLPVVALVVTGVAISVITISRYVSLGSITGAALGIAMASAAYFWGAGLEAIAYTWIAATLIIVQHRGNVGRLLSGTERRLTLGAGGRR